MKVTLLLDEDVRKKGDALAEIEHRSLSGQISWLIERAYVEKQKQKTEHHVIGEAKGKKKTA